MAKLFLEIFNLSITASYLIAAVILARLVLRKAPKNICCFLWFLVGVRLVFPFSVESVFSLIPERAAVQEGLLSMEVAPADSIGLPSGYGNAAGVAAVMPEHMDSGTKGPNRMAFYIDIASKVWATGIIALTAYLAVSWYCLKRKVCTAVPCVHGDVKYYQCDNISTPFLFGFISPKIYVPSGLAAHTPDGTDAGELEYVLKHELTHRRRRDYLIKPAGYLLLTVYWFNPFVWAAYILLCRDIELACDEQVIKQLGTECRKDYSQALLSCSVSRRSIAACPVAFGGIGIKQRVKNVLSYRRPTFWVLVAAASACVVIVVCFMTQKDTASETTALGAAEKADTEKEATADTGAEHGAADTVLTQLDVSSVFTLYLPEELAQKLSFEVVNDLEVAVNTADEKYGIGKLYVMPVGDVLGSMARDEFYLIGNYGANGALEGYYASTMAFKELPFEGEVPKNEGVVLIPNADAAVSPELLPNAGEEFQNDALKSATEVPLLCYIFIPYGSWDSDRDGELAALQAQFLGYLEEIKVTEPVVSSDTRYSTENPRFTAGSISIEEAILEKEKEIEVFRRQLEEEESKKEAEEREAKKKAMEELLQALEAEKAALMEELEKAGQGKALEELHNSSAEVEKSIKEAEEELKQDGLDEERRQDLNRLLALYEAERTALQEALEQADARTEEERKLLENYLESIGKAMDDVSGQINGSEHLYAYYSVSQWAEAFCNRDAAVIIKMADETAEEHMADALLLEGGINDKGMPYASFGWSSPWPWDSGTYSIQFVSGTSAVILYYAWTSDPHVTVWREELTYQIKDGTFLVTSENLKYYDNICTKEEFYEAYPGGIISGTQMDYLDGNGAGGALNDNAKENRHMSGNIYHLSEPDMAALNLLNLLHNENKVKTSVEYTNADKTEAIVTFRFMLSQGDNTVRVRMIKPYGDDGIWVPQTCDETASGDAQASLSPSGYMMYNTQNIREEYDAAFQKLEVLFPDHHEPQENTSVSIDLNGDGKKETISMTDLRYNGGDGGYAVSVKSGGKEIPMPEGYTEDGFGFYGSYQDQTGKNADNEVILTLCTKDGQTIATFTRGALYALYEAKGMIQGYKNVTRSGSGTDILCDAVSGFAVEEIDGVQTLILKSYVSGLCGHVDCLGYVLTYMQLDENLEWGSIRHSFVPDGNYTHGK